MGGPPPLVVVVLVLFLSIILALVFTAACGQRPDQTIRAGQSEGIRPPRYRFEDDRVTCYVWGQGISCLADR